jgi:hypothetical protein
MGMKTSRLKARCVIREETFAGTHGNGRDAPISDVRKTAIEPREAKPARRADSCGSRFAHPVII